MGVGWGVGPCRALQVVPPVWADTVRLERWGLGA